MNVPNYKKKNSLVSTPSQIWRKFLQLRNRSARISIYRGFVYLGTCFLLGTTNLSTLF